MNAYVPRFEQAGATVAFISPQTVKHSFFMHDQHKPRFPLLSDAGNEVARQFGLVYRVPNTPPTDQQEIYRRVFINLPNTNGDPSWELPIPATYVLDRDGTSSTPPPIPTTLSALNQRKFWWLLPIVGGRTVVDQFEIWSLSCVKAPGARRPSIRDNLLMERSNTGSRLIIVCGLPASGKTTLARRLESRLRAVCFSPDEWMDALSLNLYDEERRGKIEGCNGNSVRNSSRSVSR